MERTNSLFTIMLGLYDSINTRVDVDINSLTGAYDKIKRIEARQRRLQARLALLEEVLIKEVQEEEKGEKEKVEEVWTKTLITNNSM
jgi:hypothetical protein